MAETENHRQKLQAFKPPDFPSSPICGQKGRAISQPELMNGSGREPCVGSPEEPGREQGRQGWQSAAGGLHALAGNRFIFTLGLGTRAGQRGEGEVEPV